SGSVHPPHGHRPHPGSRGEPFVHLTPQRQKGLIGQVHRHRSRHRGGTAGALVPPHRAPPSRAASGPGSVSQALSDSSKVVPVHTHRAVTTPSSESSGSAGINWWTAIPSNSA